MLESVVVFFVVTKIQNAHIKLFTLSIALPCIPIPQCTKWKRNWPIRFFILSTLTSCNNIKIVAWHKVPVEWMRRLRCSPTSLLCTFYYWIYLSINVMQHNDWERSLQKVRQSHMLHILQFVHNCTIVKMMKKKHCIAWISGKVRIRWLSYIASNWTHSNNISFSCLYFCLLLFLLLLVRLRYLLSMFEIFQFPFRSHDIQTVF